MIHHHPPSEQVRTTIQEFKSEKRPAPGMHNQGCACCRVAKPPSKRNEMVLFGVVIFTVTLVLVGLNAYQRDRIDNETADAHHGFGPGASQAAELSFPTKTPTAGMYTAVPMAPQATQQQYAYVPVATVRPGEPALQYMAVPYNDGKGTIRLKRVVGR